MSSRRQKITLQPKVLRWARERVGLSQEDLAKRIPVSVGRVKEWEETGKISIAQTGKLAAKTYTPLGYLYLSEPPDESLPIRDFRTRDDNPPKGPSPNLLDTVYQMQRRQAWMRDDLIEGGADPLPFVDAYSLTNNHTEVAASMRDALGLADGWAEDVYTWSDALRTLHERLEGARILAVFNGVVGNNTSRKLDPNEFQGFALVDEYAPLVFVNSADFKAAQIFTLAHEVAHLFIGETGLSSLDRMLPANNETERYCNQVAAEFLVPQRVLKEYWPTVQNQADRYQFIARRFKVSVIVAARRLLDLGLIDRETFFVSYNDFKGQGRTAPSSNGGGNFWHTQKWRIGTRFAGAVARAAREGRLTYRDAYSLTDLKGDAFERMPEELGVTL